jgi:hypothetical protein
MKNLSSKVRVLLSLGEGDFKNIFEKRLVRLDVFLLKIRKFFAILAVAGMVAQ